MNPVKIVISEIYFKKKKLPCVSETWNPVLCPVGPARVFEAGSVSK